MAFTLSEINLVLQAVILVVFLTGYLLKRRGVFRLHGTAMFVAVVLNLVSFLVVMGPSFLGLSPFVAMYPLNSLSLLTLLHGALGALVEAVGIFLVASWHLQKSTKGCVPKRRIMRFTIILWIVTWILGFVLYGFLYTTWFPSY